MLSHRAYNNTATWFPRVSFSPAPVDSVKLEVSCCCVCTVESSCLIMLVNRDPRLPYWMGWLMCFYPCLCSRSFVSGRGGKWISAVAWPSLSPACAALWPWGTPVRCNLIIIIASPNVTWFCLCETTWTALYAGGLYQNLLCFETECIFNTIARIVADAWYRSKRTYVHKHPL